MEDDRTDDDSDDDDYTTLAGARDASSPRYLYVFFFHFHFHFTLLMSIYKQGNLRDDDGKQTNKDSGERQGWI
jgi:hypothetical protein